MMLDPAQDEAFMRLALEQAALAPASGEVPIAALLVPFHDLRHFQIQIGRAHV